MSLFQKRIAVITLLISALILLGCATKKKITYRKGRLPRGATIAIIIDSPNNVKNVVMAQFMKKRFNVKAVNASDIYETSDIFNLKDFKKVSYKGNSPQSLVSMERAYNNVYKLHVYNYEINKAAYLEEMRQKWNVQYLILLDLKNWEKVSWGRVIDLRNFEIVWLENYPTTYNDTIETVIAHFIKAMTGR